MAKSVVDIALANLDAQIAELQRAKEILQMAAAQPHPMMQEPRKPRGRPKKAGPPADTL